MTERSRWLSAIKAQLFGRLGVFIVLVLAVCSAVTFLAPGLGLGAFCVGIAAIAASRKPAWVLAVGVFLMLTGGPFSWLAVLGVAVLGGGAAVCAVRLVLRPVRQWIAFAWLPLALLLWVLARFLLEGTINPVISLLACVAALLIAVYCLVNGDDLIQPLKWAALLFLIVSALFGVFNEGNNRFQGISGNSNRLAFASLVTIPILLTGVGRSSRAIPTVLYVTGSLIAVAFTVLSGSTQGFVGLVLLGACLVAWLLARSSLGRRLAVLVSGALLIALGGAIAATLFGLSRDLLTLSDRTPIFAAAVYNFLDSPWFGSGLEHVTGGEAVNRSAHSSTLALLANGGIVPGILWVALLAALVYTGLSHLSAGRIFAAAPLSVFLVQFVQTIEFLPLTWVVITLSLREVVLRYRANRSAKQRVVMVSRSFYPTEGGAERQLRQVADGLVASGLTVRVITQATSGRPRREVLPSGVVIARVGSASATGKLGKAFFVVGALLGGLRARGDVYLSLQLGAATVVAALVARARSAQHIVRLTGGGTADFRSEPLARASTAGGHVLARLIDRRDTKIVAPAQHLLDDFAIAFPTLPLTRQRIPNGVDLTTGVHRTSDVVWYSRSGSESSVDVFLAVARALKDTRFSVIGLPLTGPLPANVIDLGWQDDPETVIGTHHLLLNTSSNEGLPNTALQALGMGARVVGFANAGIVELQNTYGDAVTTVKLGDRDALAKAVQLALNLPPLARVKVDSIDDVTASWIAALDPRR